jgi:hypothetical protein
MAAWCGSQYWLGVSAPQVMQGLLNLTRDHPLTVSGMVSCGGVIMACACWMISLEVRIHGFGAGSGAFFHFISLSLKSDKRFISEYHNL